MSKIEWTDITHNPITVKGKGHWCRKISEGCANCYAETMNLEVNRYGDRSFASGLTYSGKAPELELNYKMLESWSRMRTSKRIFVCSMTDWCGDWIPREWQYEMLQSMNRADNQTFMVLTKRASILIEVLDTWLRKTRYAPQNIWFGISVENQRTANERLPYLAEIGDRLKANVFVSFEPLLEPVLLGDYAKYIDLAIVGAESGKGARPMDEDWVRSLRDEIKGANKAFFYKQNVVNGRKISLPKLDGKVWSELP